MIKSESDSWEGAGLGCVSCTGNGRRVGIGIGMERKLQRDLCVLSVQALGAWWAGGVQQQEQGLQAGMDREDIRTQTWMGAGDGNSSLTELPAVNKEQRCRRGV